MKIKYAFAAFALTVASTLSFAAITSTPATQLVSLQFDGIDYYTGDLNAAHGLAGSFTDTFKLGSFSTLSTAEAGVTASTRFLITGNGVNFSSAFLNGTALSLVLGTASKTYETSLMGFDFTGPLTLVVKGTSLGKGGSYGGYAQVTSTGSYAPPVSAVPEPETYAMMLAGLGLLGFAARRKAKANQA